MIPTITIGGRFGAAIWCRWLAAIVAITPILVVAAPPVALNEKSYRPHLGVLLVHINWGRTSDCGPYESAQLQGLSFVGELPESAWLDIATPSKIATENKFLPYAYVIKPGEYALAGFDVKVIRSGKETSNIRGVPETLLEKGKPVGGSIRVGAGEIVYAGHFGLDCSEEPFLWRYFIDSRPEFERFVGDFRKQYPFVRDVPVQYRLFSTTRFGEPHVIKEPTVK